MRRGTSGGRNNGTIASDMSTEDLMSSPVGQRFVVFGSNLRGRASRMYPQQLLFGSATDVSPEDLAQGPDDSDPLEGAGRAYQALGDVWGLRGSEMMPIVPTIGQVEMERYAGMEDPSQVRMSAVPEFWHLGMNDSGQQVMVPSAKVAALSPWRPSGEDLPEWRVAEGKGSGRGTPEYVAYQYLRHRAREEASLGPGLRFPGLDHLTVAGANYADRSDRAPLDERGRVEMLGAGLTIMHRGRLNAMIASSLLGGLIHDPETGRVSYNTPSIRNPFPVRTQVRGKPVTRTADEEALETAMRTHGQMFSRFKERFPDADMGRTSFGLRLLQTKGVDGMSALEQMYAQMAHMHAMGQIKDLDERLGGLLHNNLRQAVGISARSPSALPRPVRAQANAMAEASGVPRDVARQWMLRGRQMHTSTHNDRGNLLSDAGEAHIVDDVRSHPDLAGFDNPDELGKSGSHDPDTMLRTDTVTSPGTVVKDGDSKTRVGSGRVLPTKTADIHNSYVLRNPEAVQGMSAEDITVAALREHHLSEQGKKEKRQAEKEAAAQRKEAVRPLLEAIRDHNEEFSQEFSRDGKLQAVETRQHGEPERIEVDGHAHRIVNTMEHAQHIVRHLNGFLDSLGAKDPEKDAVTIDPHVVLAHGETDGKKERSTVQFLRIIVNKDHITDPKVSRELMNLHAMAHASKHYKIILANNGTHRQFDPQKSYTFKSASGFNDTGRVAVTSAELSTAQIKARKKRDQQEIAAHRAAMDAEKRGETAPPPVAQEQKTLNPAQFSVVSDQPEEPAAQVPETPTVKSKAKSKPASKPRKPPAMADPDRALKRVKDKFRLQAEAAGFRGTDYHEGFTVVPHDRSPSGRAIYVGANPHVIQGIEKLRSDGAFDDVLKHHTILSANDVRAEQASKPSGKR